MLIDFKQEVKRRGLHVRGILHLGANKAQEKNIYYDIGCHKVFWVEANPELAGTLKTDLKKYPGNKVIIGLINDKPFEKIWFNISNFDSMSSSMFEFGTHSETAPDTVWVDRVQLETTTVDLLASQEDFSGVNTLVMDLQGAELRALMGAEQFLKNIDYIYTEVSYEEVYVGGAQIEELTRYLAEREFKPVLLHWATYGGDDVGVGWGDALYVRGGV